jgi:general secretion pathway protein N
MGSRSAWLGLGAGAYLAATVALLPAATAYRWLAPLEVTAVGLEGTIWRGRAALVSVAGIGASDVEWTMAFTPLLIGRIEIALQARQPDGFVSTNVVAGLASVRLLDLQATTTLATLGQLVPLGDVRGQISAQLAELELRDGWPEHAIGQIRIAGLETPLLMPGGPSGLIPLGNYLVTLEDRSDGLLGGHFTDQGGPLEITGAFALTADRNYELSGLILPRPDTPQEIVQALQFLTGPPDADGRRPFELTGSL